MVFVEVQTQARLMVNKLMGIQHAFVMAYFICCLWIIFPYPDDQLCSTLMKTDMSFFFIAVTVTYYFIVLKARTVRLMDEKETFWEKQLKKFLLICPWFFALSVYTIDAVYLPS